MSPNLSLSDNREGVSEFFTYQFFFKKKSQVENIVSHLIP
jgi:hypothetical protein